MTAPASVGRLRTISTRLLALGIVAVVVLFACPLGFWLAERGRSGDVDGIGSAYTWLVRTSIEGASPYRIRTAGGFLSYYAVKIAGVSAVALLTGSLASRFVSQVIVKGRHMGSTARSGHVIICGWSSKGPEIIRELRSREVEEHRPIVVLAMLDEHPSRGLDIEFLRGDPTDEVDLRRAGIDRASTAILLSDELSAGATAGDRDARTLLTVLAVEAVSPSCYTCVEVVRRENRCHFERTLADELVVSAELTGSLLAGSARTHGLSKVVGDLVTHPDGSEFYELVLGAEMVGTTFGDVIGWCKTRYDALAVAVVAGGRPVVNPPAGRPMAAGEKLLVIASDPARLRGQGRGRG